MNFDVAIVGGGPAGASCASFAVAAGLRVLVLERENFPREKVCGDCLNPSCWPVLERLGLGPRVRGLSHGVLDAVQFISIGGHSVSVPLPRGQLAEIAVKRSLLDDLLLKRAGEQGADIRHSTVVTGVEQESSGAWNVQTGAETFTARALIGADGRNSSIARLLNLLPPPARERVALQTHIPLPADFGNKVVLQFLPEGYSGQAPVGADQLNLCLVSVARDITALKIWAEARFAVPRDHPWRTITPLTRAPMTAAQNGLFFVGDAARVVEPFTGEGIYYALASGELAAQAVVRLISGQDPARVAIEYKSGHALLYRGRLWVNRLARAAVLSPRVGSFFVQAARIRPSVLRMLTAKIVR